MSGRTLMTRRVFESGLLASALTAPAPRGGLEVGRKTFGVAFGGFAIDEQPDAFLQRQGIEIGRHRCSSKALAIPIKPSVISRSWVRLKSLASVATPLVVAAGVMLSFVPPRSA